MGALLVRGFSAELLSRGPEVWRPLDLDRLKEPRQRHMIVRADTRGDRISLTAKYVRDDPCERGMPTAAD